MKKTTAIILAVIMIIAVLASCGRRDQYRDPVGTETNAGTTTPTTNAVTDQPDNPDESDLNGGFFAAIINFFKKLFSIFSIF